MVVPTLFHLFHIRPRMHGYEIIDAADSAILLPNHTVCPLMPSSFTTHFQSRCTSTLRRVDGWYPAFSSPVGENGPFTVLPIPFEESLNTPRCFFDVLCMAPCLVSASACSLYLRFCSFGTLSHLFPFYNHPFSWTLCLSSAISHRHFKPMVSQRAPIRAL